MEAMLRSWAYLEITIQFERRDIQRGNVRCAFAPSTPSWLPNHQDICQPALDSTTNEWCRGFKISIGIVTGSWHALRPRTVGLTLWGTQRKLYGAHRTIGDGNGHWKVQWCFGPGTDEWATLREYVRDDVEIFVIIYETTPERSEGLGHLESPGVLQKVTLWCQWPGSKATVI